MTGDAATDSSGSAATGSAPTEHVRLEVEAGVATLRLDRPRMNALDAATQAAIGAAAQEAADRDDVAAVVVWGGPTVFAAGADIKEMAAMSAADMAEQAPRLQEAFRSLAHLPKPTVAAVNGYALGGGCELALCCDRRIAGSSAVLGQPEVLLGVLPGAGGSQRLPRLIGPSRAKDLIYTGRHVPAEEAVAIGLVDEVVPDEQVYERAVQWARQFVGGPRWALAAIKKAVDDGLDGDLDAGLTVETKLFAAAFETEDRAAGMESFLRDGPGKATFTGR